MRSGEEEGARHHVTLGSGPAGGSWEGRRRRGNLKAPNWGMSCLSLALEASPRETAFLAEGHMGRLEAVRVTPGPPNALAVPRLPEGSRCLKGN